MPTLRYPLALAALTVALPALAQQPSPPQSPSTTPPASQSQRVSPTAGAPSTGSFMTEMRAGLWRVSKLSGIDVYNAQNEKIGDINEVLMDQQGKAQAVVIGVGGFLGMGEHDVAIPFDQIKFVDEPMRTAGSTSGSGTSGATSGTTTSGGSTTAGGTAPGNTANQANAPRNVDRTDVTGTTRSASDSRRGYPDHAILNMTKDQLKAAPQFRYSTTGNR